MLRAMGQVDGELTSSRVYGRIEYFKFLKLTELVHRTS